ncbi:protein GalK [Edwardsiella piscicida]|nr:protein GalK [Edwardsiella piscicida]
MLRAGGTERALRRAGFHAQWGQRGTKCGGDGMDFPRCISVAGKISACVNGVTLHNALTLIIQTDENAT